MSQLTVDRAAILGDDDVVYSCDRPRRHHDVIKQAREFGYGGSVERAGFVLSDGRFVSRKAALFVARRAGQLLERAPTAGSWAHGLFSEDVW